MPLLDSILIKGSWGFIHWCMPLLLILVEMLKREKGNCFAPCEKSVSSFPYKVILLGKKCGRREDSFYLSHFLASPDKKKENRKLSDWYLPFWEENHLWKTTVLKSHKKINDLFLPFSILRSLRSRTYSIPSLKNWGESSWEKWLRYFSGTINSWKRTRFIFSFLLQTKLLRTNVQTNFLFLSVVQ